MTPEAHETIRTACSAVVAVAALIGPIISIARYGKAAEQTPDPNEQRIKERRFLFIVEGSSFSEKKLRTRLERAKILTKITEGEDQQAEQKGDGQPEAKPEATNQWT